MSVDYTSDYGNTDNDINYYNHDYYLYYNIDEDDSSYFNSIVEDLKFKFVDGVPEFDIFPASEKPYYCYGKTNTPIRMDFLNASYDWNKVLFQVQQTGLGGHIIELSCIGKNLNNEVDETFFILTVNSTKKGADEMALRSLELVPSLPADEDTAGVLNTLQEILFGNYNYDYIIKSFVYSRNEVKLTNYAAEYIGHKRFTQPFWVEDVLKGSFKENLPDVSTPFSEVDKQLEDLKLSKKLKIYKPEPVNGGGKEFDYSSVNLRYILESTSFHIVTTKDCNYTKVQVTDIFTGREEEEIVPPFDDKELWGVYCPKHGSIYLYIDNIFKSANESYSWELIFQKVLVHEIIHALLDISLRVIKDQNGKKQSTFALSKNLNTIDKEVEETIDNALVLQVYNLLNEDNDNSFEKVKKIIGSQKKYYKYGVKLFEDWKTNKRNMKEDVLALLCDKIAVTESPSCQIHQIDNEVNGQ